MVAKQLKYVLAIGKILGIVPINPHHPPCFQHLYATSIILVEMVASVFWFVDRYPLYGNYIHVKLITRILRHVIRKSLVCYGVLHLNYFKRGDWLAFVQRLLGDSTSSVAAKCRFLYGWGFLLSNLGFLSVISYSAYVYRTFFAVTVSEGLVEVWLEWYSLFYNNFLILATAWTILQRYRGVTVVLQHLLEKQWSVGVGGCDEGKSDGTLLLSKVGSDLCDLKDTVDLFNDIFGWIFLGLILYPSVLFMDYVEDLFTLGRISGDEERLSIVVMNILLVLMTFSGMCAPVIICDMVAREMCKITKVSHRLRSLMVAKADKQATIDELVDYVLPNNWPRFSAAGFLHIDRRTISTILATVTTYVIIMVQFEVPPSSVK